MFTLTTRLALVLAAFVWTIPASTQTYEVYKGTQLARIKKSFDDIVETDQLYPKMKAQGRRIKNKIEEYYEFPIDESQIVYQAKKGSGGTMVPSKEQSPPPDADFLGLDDSGGSIPPDVNGAPGRDHLMVTLNTDFRIQDKEGNNLYTVGSGAFWHHTPGAGGVFDPKIAFDPYENRWVLVMPSSSDPTLSKLLIAVSENEDPTGNWYMYAFDGDPDDNHWFDYPNWGYSKDKLVVTGNLFGNGVYVAVYVFDKMDLYNHAYEVEYSRIKIFDGFTLVPSKNYDPEEEDVYLIHNAGGNSGGFGYVQLRKVTGPPSDPVIENIGLAGVPEPWSNSSGFPAGNSAPQLDSDERINTVDARMENMVYRNGTLWATHHVYLPAGNQQRSAVQWWNLSTDGEILQWGRVDDPTGELWFAFATIAVNAKDDVMVGFGSFSENQYASGSYAIRYAEDPPGTMREYYQYRDGEAPYVKTFGAARNRWGDYTSTFVDPDDDLDFWTLQEYAAMPSGSQDEWGTWWAYVDMHAVPEADFTSNIAQVPVNSGVSFEDRSKFNPTQWLWTFEGGTPETSTAQNPQNIQYNAEGFHDVTLTATNELGSNTVVMEDYIHANTTVLPFVSFSTSDTLPCTGQVVQFSDATIYNPNTWLWEFEPNLVTFVNGTDATSQNPEVSFDYPYRYTVTLTATNNNGSSTVSKTKLIHAGGLDLPFYEDFENRDLESRGWSIDNPDDDVTWETAFVGGPEQGELAAYMNIRNYAGFLERDRLISPELNFYAWKDVTLSFQHAYRQRLANYSDSLFIYISEDCGETWTLLMEIGEDPEEGRNFATSEASSEEFIPQEASDWCGTPGNPDCISLDLSEWSGKSNIHLMFETVNVYGNNLFIDNVQIDGTLIGVDESEKISTSLEVYPNPTNGVVYANLQDLKGNAEISVFTMDGSVVSKQLVNAPQIVSFDMNNLPSGIYFIEVSSEGERLIEKIILR